MIKHLSILSLTCILFWYRNYRKWRKKENIFFSWCAKNKGAETFTEWYSCLEKYKDFEVVNGKHFFVYKHLFSNTPDLFTSIWAITSNY